MKHSTISISCNEQPVLHYGSIKKHYQGPILDKVLVATGGLILTPVFAINITLSTLLLKPIFIHTRKSDALGRVVNTRRFSTGLMKDTAIIIDVLKGRLSLCGTSLNHSLEPSSQFKLLSQIQVKPGVFSLYDLHLATGLTVDSKEKLLVKQLKGTKTAYLTLLFKSLLSIAVYGSKSKRDKVKQPETLSLFGLPINNASMKQAVKWVAAKCSVDYSKDNKDLKTRIGFFVNVNSINLALSDNSFREQLAKADTLFADGSGVRIAARSTGYDLKSNNNGTDMLPHLCREFVNNGQSIFLLGSKENIADKAAHNLKAQFPGLKIAGTQHGYFNDDDEVINKINNSGCHILLVAMGSPQQENWLLKNQHKLNCTTALAVGGLFDFYSGTISRSPLWLRELGMEWVWRLIQEPKVKFNRYVIGNPLFLYRTFILRLANSEIK